MLLIELQNVLQDNLQKKIVHHLFFRFCLDKKLMNAPFGNMNMNLETNRINLNVVLPDRLQPVFPPSLQTCSLMQHLPAFRGSPNPMLQVYDQLQKKFKSDSKRLESLRPAHNYNNSIMVSSLNPSQFSDPMILNKNLVLTRMFLESQIRKNEAARISSAAYPLVPFLSRSFHSQVLPRVAQNFDRETANGPERNCNRKENGNSDEADQIEGNDGNSNVLRNPESLSLQKSLKPEKIKSSKQEISIKRKPNLSMKKNYLKPETKIVTTSALSKAGLFSPSRKQPKRIVNKQNPGKVDDLQQFSIVIPDVVELLGFEEVDQDKLLALWNRSEREIHKFFVKLRRNLSYYKKTLRVGAIEEEKPGNEDNQQFSDQKRILLASTYDLKQDGICILKNRQI